MPQSFVAALDQPIKPLKMAYSTVFTGAVKLDDVCQKALNEATALCEHLGHTVEEATPEFDYELLAYALKIIISANLRNSLQMTSKLFGHRPSPETVEPITWAFYQQGKHYTAADYAKALFILHNQSRKIAQFFTQYDVLITPIQPNSTFKLGQLSTQIDNLDEYFAHSSQVSPFTTTFNQTGQPAMSVPLYWHQDQLPIGTQFVAGLGQEALLLQLAMQLEQAKPWRKRLPSITTTYLKNHQS